MTNAKFESLVKRIEVLARRHPKGDRFMVGAIAPLGYAYMVAIAVSLIDGYYWGFLGII